MSTKEQQKIISLGKIEFLEDEVLDTDRIVIQHQGSGIGTKGLFYLYDNLGRLKDIQIGEPIDRSLSQKRSPIIKDAELQNPVVKKRGRPKKFDDVVVKKATKKTIKKKTENSKKRKYTMSEEQRKIRSLRMRATMKIYWEKKKTS